VESARLVIGLIAAVAVPASVPALRTHTWRVTLAATVYAGYIAFPVLDWGSATVISVLTTAAALARKTDRGSLQRWLSSFRPTAARQILPTVSNGLRAVKGHRMLRADAVLVIVLLLLAGWMATGLSPKAILSLFIDDNRVAIVLSGLLLAAFASNDVALVIVRPYLDVLQLQGEDLGALLPVGLHIGWIERSMTFAFICGGFPEAAALAIAARSLARLPEVQRHPGAFAHYVVVGTLANLALATSVGIVVRLCLGLSPL
jgi:hypothetical protein